MRTDWSHICTDCKRPVYGLQMSYFSFTLSEHRKSLGLGVPESPFKTTIGIIVIAIIIDLRPHYNCRTTLVQLSIQRISRLHTLLLSHGIWYTVFENPLQSTTFFLSVQNTQYAPKIVSSFSFILWTELPTSREFDSRQSYEISVL